MLSGARFAERQKGENLCAGQWEVPDTCSFRDLSQNGPVEAKEHIRRFHELFFTVSPDKAAIESNIRRALFLCDESAFRYYKDWEEKGYYNRIISANINQSIRVDSVACDFNSLPVYGDNLRTAVARQVEQHHGTEPCNPLPAVELGQVGQ